MSHFTTLQVQIKDADLLEETLKELGYAVQRDTSLRGYLWNRTRADLVIRQKNGFDIGFRRNGDHYELVADLWGGGHRSQDLSGADLAALCPQKFAALSP